MQLVVAREPLQDVVEPAAMKRVVVVCTYCSRRHRESPGPMPDRIDIDAGGTTGFARRTDREIRRRSSGLAGVTANTVKALSSGYRCFSENQRSISRRLLLSIRSVG